MYLSENWVVCTNVFFMIVVCKEKKVEKHRLRGLLHAGGCVKSNGTGSALQQFKSEEMCLIAA
jgi:hypothetical protein